MLSDSHKACSNGCSPNYNYPCHSHRPSLFPLKMDNEITTPSEQGGTPAEKISSAQPSSGACLNQEVTKSGTSPISLHTSERSKEKFEQSQSSEQNKVRPVSDDKVTKEALLSESINGLQTHSQQKQTEPLLRETSQVTTHSASLQADVAGNSSNFDDSKPEEVTQQFNNGQETPKDTDAELEKSTKKLNPDASEFAPRPNIDIQRSTVKLNPHAPEFPVPFNPDSYCTKLDPNIPELSSGSNVEQPSTKLNPEAPEFSLTLDSGNSPAKKELNPSAPEFTTALSPEASGNTKQLDSQGSGILSKLDVSAKEFLPESSNYSTPASSNTQCTLVPQHNSMKDGIQEASETQDDCDDSPNASQETDWKRKESSSSVIPRKSDDVEQRKPEPMPAKECGNECKRGAVAINAQVNDDTTNSPESVGKPKAENSSNASPWDLVGAASPDEWGSCEQSYDTVWGELISTDPAVNDVPTTHNSQVQSNGSSSDRGKSNASRRKRNDAKQPRLSNNERGRPASPSPLPQSPKSRSPQLPCTSGPPNNSWGGGDAPPDSWDSVTPGANAEWNMDTAPIVDRASSVASWVADTQTIPAHDRNTGTSSRQSRSYRSAGPSGPGQAGFQRRDAIGQSFSNSSHGNPRDRDLNSHGALNERTDSQNRQQDSRMGPRSRRHPVGGKRDAAGSRQDTNQGNEILNHTRGRGNNSVHQTSRNHDRTMRNDHRGTPQHRYPRDEPRHHGERNVQYGENRSKRYMGRGVHGRYAGGGSYSEHNNGRNMEQMERRPNQQSRRDIDYQIDQTVPREEEGWNNFDSQATRTLPAGEDWGIVQAASATNMDWEDPEGAFSFQSSQPSGARGSPVGWNDRATISRGSQDVRRGSGSSVTMGRGTWGRGEEDQQSEFPEGEWSGEVAGRMGWLSQADPFVEQSQGRGERRGREDRTNYNWRTRDENGGNMREGNRREGGQGRGTRADWNISERCEDVAGRREHSTRRTSETNEMDTDERDANRMRSSDGGTSRGHRHGSGSRDVQGNRETGRDERGAAGRCNLEGSRDVGHDQGDGTRTRNLEAIRNDGRESGQRRRCARSSGNETSRDEEEAGDMGEGEANTEMSRTERRVGSADLWLGSSYRSLDEPDDVSANPYERRYSGGRTTGSSGTGILNEVMKGTSGSEEGVIMDAETELVYLRGWKSLFQKRMVKTYSEKKELERRIDGLQQHLLQITNEQWGLKAKTRKVEKENEKLKMEMEKERKERQKIVEELREKVRMLGGETEEEDGERGKSNENEDEDVKGDCVEDSKDGEAENEDVVNGDMVADETEGDENGNEDEK